MDHVYHTVYRAATRVYLSTFCSISATSSLQYRRIGYHKLLGLEHVTTECQRRAHGIRLGASIDLLVTHITLAISWIRGLVCWLIAPADGWTKQCPVCVFMATSDKRVLSNWNRCGSIWAKILHI